jgi:hypothetical protein
MGPQLVARKIGFSFGRREVGHIFMSIRCYLYDDLTNKVYTLLVYTVHSTVYLTVGLVSVTDPC